MPVTILIGAQWGDEGKGRFVDTLGAQADIVARYSGGDNAGHTVSVGGQVHKLHLLPSGILHPQAVGVLGNGMVINPLTLVREMDELAALGVHLTPDNLKISSRAHIITPAHIALDKARERALGAAAIGTTMRGIGPAYLDKADRKGLRMGLISDIEVYLEALERHLNEANVLLAYRQAEPVDVAGAMASHQAAMQRLQAHVIDTSMYINQRLRGGALVLCEGAQGTMLDLDHGSYPYVTSSNPTVGGALTGLGIGPTQVTRVLGVAKAFSTRVGGGPMPTEQVNAIGDRLRGTGANYWDEFGTTTGRPRRCGWLDVVMLRYAVQLNGFTELALTKLDILSGFERLEVCVAYEIDGLRHDSPPSNVTDNERVVPIYETLPGWSGDISGARHAEDLPPQALAYVRRISELCGVPIHMVSVGPEREQMVTLA